VTLYFVHGINTIGASMKRAPVESEYLAAGLQYAGAVVLEERNFILLAHRDHRVQRTDRVINFFCTDENAHLVYGAVDPQYRWTYLIDERAALDGTDGYGARIRNHFPRFDVTHAIITYPSARHVENLTRASIKCAVMPHCVPSRRKRVAKSGAIVVSGTIEEATYPTRWRLVEALNHLVPELQTRVSTAPGRPYYDALDAYQFGVVCRGGTADCLVAKYVEFGMCHVLPIGDCPSYMPADMRREMIDAEHMSGEQVVAEVKRLLASPAELVARQEAYCEAVHRHYDLRENAQRAVREIITTFT